MRVLIINYFYPPVVDAHAYRWEQIARYWVGRGCQVDVISGRLFNVVDRNVQDGVNVTRVGIGARPIMHSSAEKRQINGVLGKIKVLVKNSIRLLYRKAYWPDAWWHWWPCALREALSRRHLKYDMIVSYSPCLGAHIAAAMLGWWFASNKAVWIADYGDPFSTSSTMPPNNFFLYRRLNKLVERNIAKQADALVFTNEGTAAAYCDAGICVQDKIKIVPHLADLQRLYAAGGGQRRNMERGVKNIINLLYVGGFHRGIREPDLLFDIMRSLNRGGGCEYILTIYGPTNGFDLMPSDCAYVHYRGMVRREKAMELIRGADVLVNVGNMNCVMSPSKIAEYIATGRPLLNLSSGGIDHPLISRYTKAEFAFNIGREGFNSDGICAMVKFLLRTAGKVAPIQIVENVLEGYTLKDVAERYLELASDVRRKTALD